MGASGKVFVQPPALEEVAVFICLAVTAVVICLGINHTTGRHIRTTIGLVGHRDSVGKPAGIDRSIVCCLVNTVGLDKVVTVRVGNNISAVPTLKRETVTFHPKGHPSIQVAILGSVVQHILRFLILRRLIVEPSRVFLRGVGIKRHRVGVGFPLGVSVGVADTSVCRAEVERHRQVSIRIPAHKVVTGSSDVLLSIIASGQQTGTGTDVLIFRQLKLIVSRDILFYSTTLTQIQTCLRERAAISMEVTARSHDPVGVQRFICRIVASGPVSKISIIVEYPIAILCQCVPAR